MKLKLKLGLVDSFCNPCCDIMFYFLLCCSCWASCDWFCQRENSIWTKRNETKTMDWQASDSHASYGRYFSHFLRIQDRFYYCFFFCCFIWPYIEYATFFLWLLRLLLPIQSIYISDRWNKTTGKKYTPRNKLFWNCIRKRNTLKRKYWWKQRNGNAEKGIFLPLQCEHVFVCVSECVDVHLVEFKIMQYVRDTRLVS